MTHDEMIAVIQAHKDGAKIECREVFADSSWELTKDPCWNFNDFEYRIAEPRWRDATIDDLKRAPLKCRVRQLSDCDWQESKLIEYSASPLQGWRTIDFFWHTQCQVIDE